MIKHGSPWDFILEPWHIYDSYHWPSFIVARLGRHRKSGSK